MIKFQPSVAQLVLTNDQLCTITRIAGGLDAEVVDHGHTQRVTLYVKHEGYEIRHEIEEDGQVNGVERGVEVDEDWEWESVAYEPRNHPSTEVLHEAMETIGQDTLESGIILVNNDHRPVAYAQLGKTTVCISRSKAGHVSIEIDDVAEEPVYMSVNLQTLTAIADDDEHVPWNGRQ